MTVTPSTGGAASGLLTVQAAGADDTSAELIGRGDAAPTVTLTDVPAPLEGTGEVTVRFSTADG